MERWEFLKPGGFCFAWDDDLFPPGLDTFLIASMPVLKSGLRICDLGSGTGLLSMILFQRQPDINITGIEILPEAVTLAERCAVKNNLSDRFRTICMDMKNIIHMPDLSFHALFGPPFDLVISNPPYYAARGRALSDHHARRVARSESACTLSDLAHAAARLLRNGGRLCIIYKPERLTDLLYTLRETRLEPKKLRFVCQNPYAAPSLILLEARRNGKPGLSVEPPFMLYHPDGSSTKELDSIYFRA